MKQGLDHSYVVEFLASMHESLGSISTEKKKEKVGEGGEEGRKKRKGGRDNGNKE